MPKERKKNSISLAVVGHACTVFQNDKYAAVIHEGRHLIPWKGTHTDRLVDRYDVRNLLDDERLFLPKEKSRFPHIDKEEELCENERYRDLLGLPASDDEEESSVVEEEREKKRRKVEQMQHEEPSSTFHQVTFDYQRDNNTIAENESTSTETSIYVPKFPIPSEIETPKTKVQHQIIFRTAKYIASRRADANKAELLLKLKQSKNPNFGFLEESNAFHSYYLFIKKNLTLLETWMNLDDVSTEDSILLGDHEPPKKESSKDLQQRLNPVVPPADIQAIVDKTLEYVIKSGGAFEKTLQEKEKNNPKFSFLFSGGQYNDYYQQRTRALAPSNEPPETPTTNQVEAGPGSATNDATESATKTNDPDDVAKKKEKRLKKAKLMMALLKQ